MTDNQNKLNDILDCVYTFKMSDSLLKNYHNGINTILNKCKSAASIMREDVVHITTVSTNGQYTQETLISFIRAYANNVVKKISSIDYFIKKAKNAGYLPPISPVQELLKYNNNRSIKKYPYGDKKNYISLVTVPEKLADDMMFNLNILLSLLDMQKNGDFSLSGKTKENNKQISAFGIDLSYFDFASSALEQGILSFIPDLDQIKRKRIQDVLESLDFKNRIPKIICTMNYDPDGYSKGTIVCWKKMYDASAYDLYRTNVLTGEKKEFHFSNKDIENESLKIKNYVTDWALTFYPALDENKVFSFLDSTTEKDNVYVYNLVARQNIRKGSSDLFNSETTPLLMSSLQLKDMANEMDSYVKFAYEGKIEDFDKDDINPYPFLSKRFFGNDKYDWVLAATNIIASKNRNDTKEETRQYSYLNCKFSFLENKIKQNILVRPKNIDSIINKIRDSITSFGVSQTLMQIIQSTGLDIFFGAVESIGNDEFKKASNVFDESELTTLDAILATIDVDNATVDVKSLSNTLLLITKGKSELNLKETSPEEFDANINEKTSLADNSLQFVGNLDSVSSVLDLTTFEGISDFIRIVRLFFDANPDKKKFGELSEDGVIIPKDEFLKTKLTAGGSTLSEKSKLIK